MSIPRNVLFIKHAVVRISNTPAFMDWLSFLHHNNLNTEKEREERGSEKMKENLVKLYPS